MSTTPPFDPAPPRVSRYAVDDITAGRHRGSEMSESAHDAIRPHKREQQQRVLAFLERRGSYGATSEEIAGELGMPYTSVSARCSELKRDGRIVASGCRRETTSGAMAAVVIVARFA